jgi:CheY-like chemotaxis protein
MSRTTHPELVGTRYSFLPRFLAYSHPVNDMKLLIVEDNPQMRSFIKSLVRELADDIHECSDGVEVFAAYTLHRPDWVLMDVEMEQMDGLTASRQLIGSYPDARIVIVTRYDDEELRKEAQAAGACGYVLKEDLSVLKDLLAPPQARSND